MNGRLGPLVLLPGGGNASASQRREAHLRAMNDHLLQIIAVLAIQQGGLVMVPGKALERAYDLTATRDPQTGNIVYSAKPTAGAALPLMPALDDVAADLDKKEPS